MSYTALVTGASGLLGRHVVERLARAGRVARALVRSEQGAQIARQAGARDIMVGDLRDEGVAARAVCGAERVFNCAATVRTTGSWEDFASVNVHATRRLLQASLEANVERFVHISSTGIFPLPNRGQAVTEDTPIDPLAPKRGHYTRSKALADELVREWAARHELAVTLIRPGHIFGPSRPMFGRLARPLKGNFYLVLANPNSLLGFTWVENCADAVVRAGEANGGGFACYNVIDDEFLTQRRFLEAVRRVAGSKYRFLIVPASIFAPLRLLPPKSRFGNIAYRLLRACASIHYRTDKLRNELNWQPPVPLDEAVRRMLAGDSGPRA